jgi:hypothetical protein
MTVHGRSAMHAVLISASAVAAWLSSKREGQVSVGEPPVIVMYRPAVPDPLLPFIIISGRSVQSHQCRRPATSSRTTSLSNLL